MPSEKNIAPAAGSSGILRFMRRLRRNERGATAVEFALIAGPFLLLIVALVETAVLHLTSLNLENSLKEATRLIRTGQAQVANLDASQFRAKVCENVYLIKNCTTNANLLVDIRSFDNFGAGAVPDMFDDEGDWTEDPSYTPGAGLKVVIARAYYKIDLLTQIPGIGLANIDYRYRMLDAVSVFRNEPF